MIGIIAYDSYHRHINHHKPGIPAVMFISVTLIVKDYFEISGGFICAIVSFFLLILFANHVKFVVRNLTTIEYPNQLEV